MLPYYVLGVLHLSSLFILNGLAAHSNAGKPFRSVCVLWYILLFCLGVLC